jgi:DNA-binding transcriptional regulator YhcF (GntR family)
MAAAQTETNERILRRNEEKWSAPLMDAGWTVLPSIILEKQHALGLDPIDVNILMQLARHWWFNDNLPHPSKTTLAECMSVNPSTVRRRIAQMEKDGLIKRVARYDQKHRGQTSNFYEFDGLIKAATPFAQEAIATREERRAEDVIRRSRKKPKLIVDNTAPSPTIGKKARKKK